MKSFYGYISDAWSSPREGYVGALRQDRLKAWRQESTVQRIDWPTRLDRARALGYKAKQGRIVARVKVRRGGRKKSRYERNRKTSKMGVNSISMGKSIQRIAEERAGRRFRNMEVLNSYWVAEDGKQKWYEVILIDPSHPAIQNDKDLNWVRDQFSQQLLQRFVNDNTLQPADRSTADSIIEGVITSVKDAPVVVEGGDQVAKRRISITAHVVFRDLKLRKKVWERDFTQWGDYSSGGGLTQRNDGVAEAVRKITEDILNETVAGW